MKLHDGEAEIDAGLVRRLIAAQFPQLSSLPVSEVRPTGTVNAMYRLGAELCVRLPRLERWARGLRTECTWLPRLAPGLSLQIPEPVGLGEPVPEYPFSWAVFRWIHGRTYTPDRIDNELQAAADLARFVAELRRQELPAAGDIPRSGRPPLADADAETRDWVARAGDAVDGQAFLSAWEEALRGPAWNGAGVWIHADLLPPNLLVRNGRLRAVIDFGSVGVGDPANDLNPAWSVLGPGGRAVFREMLGADDDLWQRGRGIVLSQAIALIPYYATTNPGLAALGRRMIREVLADMAGHG
jgi:aminoglycoside phosphotransferase (APT) family kinase protein